MPYYALDYLPYQYLRKARRGRSGRSAVLGQAVKSAGIRNGNVALFSKITHCAPRIGDLTNVEKQECFFYTPQ